MEIGTAHTAGLDLDINIVVTERLWCHIILMEFRPFLRILNLEANEGIWVTHLHLIKSSLGFQERGFNWEYSRKANQREKEKGVGEEDMMRSRDDTDHGEQFCLRTAATPHSWRGWGVRRGRMTLSVDYVVLRCPVDVPSITRSSGPS
jgi:hypothetical protein